MAEKSIKTQYVEGIGRRKTSVARVRVSTGGKAAITVNERPFEEYFPTEALRTVAKQPLAIASTEKYHITVKVNGGGISSQSVAVSHGLARAIVKAQADLKAPLKKAKLLTRDARIKERRKFGLKKARKSPQWSKR